MPEKCTEVHPRSSSTSKAGSHHKKREEKDEFDHDN
jgi:hypothetical protein